MENRKAEPKPPKVVKAFGKKRRVGGGPKGVRKLATVNPFAVARRTTGPLKVQPSPFGAGSSVNASPFDRMKLHDPNPKAKISHKLGFAVMKRARKEDGR